MTSIIISVIAVLGSIAVAYISNNKKEERKIQLFEKLSTALSQEKSTKLEVCEYFRLATGIRMKYSDVKSIVDEENSIWLIYFLQKNSGYIQYEDGKLTHTKRFSNEMKRKIFLKIETFQYKYMIYTSALMYLISFIGLLFFAKSPAVAILFIIMLFVSAFGMVYISRNRAKVEKLEELLVLAETKE